MKLLNIDEEAPEYFYIFIGSGSDIPSQINYHNYLLDKRLRSNGFINVSIQPDKINDFINGGIVYAPFVPNKTTFLSPSSHLQHIVNSYQTEYILEYYRPKTYPSRFSCLYAFGDYESCEKANKLYPKKIDLSKVRKFKLISIPELDNCIKIVKCNMEIVTRMWNDHIISYEQDSIQRLAEGYWNGTGQVLTERQDIETGKMNQTPTDVLYEYLIEGILEEVE